MTRLSKNDKNLSTNLATAQSIYRFLPFFTQLQKFSAKQHLTMVASNKINCNYYLENLQCLEILLSTSCQPLILGINELRNIIHGVEDNKENPLKIIVVILLHIH